MNSRNTDTNGLQELVLLSQRELLASQTLFDLWNEKNTTSTPASWSSYVPPSEFTSQVLANIENTENGFFNPSSFSGSARHQTSSEEEEEEELVDDEEEEEEEDIQRHHYTTKSKKSSSKKPLTNSPSTADASLLLEIDKSNKTTRNGLKYPPASLSSSSSDSPPSSPVSSFAQQMTSLNLSNSPSSSTFPIPQSHHSETTSNQNTKKGIIPFSSLPPLHESSPSIPNKPNGLYHSFWDNSSAENNLRSFNSRDLNRTTSSHVPFAIDRQALPLRRSMSLEQQRQNHHQSSLPRKRPSSDSIVSSHAKIPHTINTNSIPIHHSNSSTSLSPSSSPLSTSPNSLSSTQLSITLAHSASQKPRPKKKRRRRDEIERKFTCLVSDCAKCYGSEGALKTHVKLKHPDIYVEQFSWKGGIPSLSSSPPSSPPSSSMITSPVNNRSNNLSLQPPVLRAL